MDAVASFLRLLEEDIDRHGEKIVFATEAFTANLDPLTAGIEVDYDVAIEGEPRDLIVLRHRRVGVMPAPRSPKADHRAVVAARPRVRSHSRVGPRDPWFRRLPRCLHRLRRPAASL